LRSLSIQRRPGHQPVGIRARVRSRALLLMVCTCLTWLPGLPAWAQTPEQLPLPADTSTPIPDVEISLRAGTARAMARDAESRAVPDGRLSQIQEAYPGLQQRIERLLDQTEALLESSGSTILVREVEKTALRARERLNRWIRDVSLRSAARQTDVQNLKAEKSRWEQTATLQRPDALPPALQDQVAETLSSLLQAENTARAARDSVLALQADIAQQQAVLESIILRLHGEISDRSTRIFSFDSPPLWKAIGSGEGRLEDLLDQVGEAARWQWQDLRGYMVEEGASVSTWLVLWLGLATLLLYSRPKLQSWAQKDQALQAADLLFARPVAAAAVIILVLGNIIGIQAPAAWLATLNLLLSVSVVYLLLGTLPRAAHLPLYLLIPGFVLFQMVNLAPVASITQRLAIIALALVGGAFCLAQLRVLRADHSWLSDRFSKLLARGLRLGLLLLAIGLISSIGGGMGLGALLIVGTSSAIFAGVVLWVVTLLLRFLVRLALVTDLAYRAGISPQHSEAIRRRLFRIISATTAILWVVFALRGFALFEPVATRILGLLRAELSIGEISLALGDLLLFLLITWLSIKFAAFVSFIVGDLVLPRLRMPQGAPHAISRLLRYTIIFIGLVIATRALGFDLSQAAIVAGGLGVGIGFGLQNVVSNFAAGLILLFERPIRVGDIVELGATGGTVEKIGMRATLVRTWRGSELIVPNSQLISSDVVNWTLMHDRRRIEISVGVDYGSDPEVVARLLTDIAINHPGIDAEPTPQCLFMGFGDSSLDFQLRAWAGAAKCLGLESELRFAINRKLKEAGITIPFPQRDLHVRSGPAKLPDVIAPD
jgi:potassium efflux system protein